MKTQTITLPSSARVDALRHMHDHATRVEFTCPKLAAIMASVAAEQSAKITIKKGESHVEVTRLGRVTITTLYTAVGGSLSTRVHYRNDAESLHIRYTAGERATDRSPLGNQKTLEVLVSRLIGEATPDSIRQGKGRKQDILRDWLRSDGWAQYGEIGLRALALAAKTEKKEAALASARRNAESLRLDIERHNRADYDARLLRLRDETRAQIAKAKTDTQTIALSSRVEVQALAATGIERPTLPQLWRDFAPNAVNVLSASTFRWRDSDSGFSTGTLARRWQTLGQDNCPIYFYPGTPETVTPGHLRPNYTVTLDSEGKITLSSGIKPDVSAAQVLAWLRGEAPAPVSKYGTMQRIETCEKVGDVWRAKTLVKCGCHLLDIAHLGAELAQAIAPTHTVTVVPATEQAMLYPTDVEGWREKNEAFLSRRLAEIDTWEALRDEQREAAIARYLASKREIEKMRDGKPAEVARLEALIVETEAKIASLALDMATTAQHGPTVAMLNKWACDQARALLPLSYDA